jgi:peptidyl-prolyl cis-trans isomerase D
MVKPFNDLYSTIVLVSWFSRNRFWFHIIKITDKQDGIRLATVAQKLEASEATSDKVFTHTKFEMEAADKDFNALAKRVKLTVSSPLTVGVMQENLVH